MAFLTFKQSPQTAPSSTTVKNALLTAAEIDGNLISLNADIQRRLLRSGEYAEGPIDWNGVASIASMATTNIGAATSNIVNVTGNVAITSFGTVPAGAHRIVVFSGTPVITYNATSMILPYGANINAVAGDSGIFVSLGSGNWKCISWSRDLLVPATTDDYLVGDKTWGNFFAKARAAVLTGLSTATNAVLADTDTVLQAFGKLQAQVSSRQPTLVSGTNIKTIDGNSILGSGNVVTKFTDANTPSDGTRLSINTRYHLDGNTTSGFVYYLPSPVQGSSIEFIDMYGNWDSGAWYVGYDATGGRVMGLTENMLVNRPNYNFKLVYTNATGGWRIV